MEGDILFMIKRFLAVSVYLMICVSFLLLIGRDNTARLVLSTLVLETPSLSCNDFLSMLDLRNLFTVSKSRLGERSL